MWQALLWVFGIGAVILSVFFVVLLFKRKHVSQKPLKAAKYILIALVPLIWGIGRMVAESDAGRDKAGALAMLVLLLTAAASFLGDIRRDM